MDGEAISEAFATQSGPDCLKDVIQKYGLRLKVYRVLKQALGAQEVIKSTSAMQLAIDYSLYTGGTLHLQASQVNWSPTFASPSTSGYDAVSSNFLYFSYCMYPIAMHSE